MGLGTADLKNVKIAGTAARRFFKERQERPVAGRYQIRAAIPATNGSKKRTYLIALIDEATRYVCHAQFYNNQRLPILEDSFRKILTLP